MLMPNNSVVENAMSMVIDRGLHVSRCSETGAPLATLDDSTLRETLEAYWMDSPTLTAEQVADLWEGNHFLLNFRLSPLFQRTLVAQQRENRYARLAKTPVGRSRLFAYFLTRILYPDTKSLKKDSVEFYSTRNRFLAFAFDWAAHPDSESFVEEMVLNLSLIEAMTDVQVFMRQFKVRERIKGLLPAITDMTEESFVDNVARFIETLWDQLRWTDDEIAGANQPVARAVSVSLGDTIARENREAKATEALRAITQRFNEVYAGGKVVKHVLTLKQAQDRLKAKTSGKGAAKPKISAEAKATVVARFSSIMSMMKADNGESM